MRGSLLPVVLAAVSIAGCGGSGDGTVESRARDTSGGSTAVTGPTTGGRASAEPAPTTRPPDPGVLGFTAAAVGGGTVDGAGYAARDLAIWFWAPH